MNQANRERVSGTAGDCTRGILSAVPSGPRLRQYCRCGVAPCCSIPASRFAGALGLALLVLVSLACGSEPASAKNVLVLDSFTQRDVFDGLEPLKGTIRSHCSEQVNFEVEYLESQRFRLPGYEESVSQTLRNVYGEEKLDLVVVHAYPALRFAVEHRDAIFPGVPIVFVSVALGRIHETKLWPGVTGVTTTVDVQGTIELALHLHPDFNNVAVISGESEFEKYWLEATRQALHSQKRSLATFEFVGLPTDQVLEKVSTLPPKSLVLFELVPMQAVQPVMGTYDLLRVLASRFPTYCIHNYCVDHGAIGGSYPNSIEQGVKGGEVAARVLSGERPEKIPVVHGSIAHVEVDWRQLRHWNIPESALPPESVVLYRQPTLWEHYQKYMVAASALIVAQALLIAGLLWQRARKRTAEAVLRESEERFRVMADTTPSLVWMCDPHGKITYLNDRLIAFTGPDPDAGYGDIWIDYVRPDDQKNVLDTIAQALKDRQPFSMEYCLRRSDGVYRWMFDVASPRVNGDGSFAGFIGSAIDITDQKRAQEALEKVSSQLIEAQEKERSRIARDLHDDICQRLALLSMELEQANRNGAPPTTKQRLEDIRQHCSEITRDVQSLSHQLHSSRLEYLGIVAAIKGFSKELATKHEIEIEVKDENMPSNLRADVSLCLFRVAQEALHNAVKYSGTSQLAVELIGTANEVRLVVKDAGAGFDVEEAKRDHGLGLVSMQERVHMVHGRLFVESAPGKGTRVVATVPAAEDAGATASSAGDARSGVMGAA